MNTDSSVPLDAQKRADGLHAFVGPIFPNFTPKAALQIVEQVSAHWLESPKDLARSVRAALAGRGYAISHASALQAASRIQGYSDYFHVPKAEPLLQFIDTAGFGTTRIANDWRDCSALMCEACDRWLQDHPESTVISLECRSTGLSFFSTRPSAEAEQSPGRNLFAFVRPHGSRPWLTPAMGPAVEAVRRRIEEAQPRATLDGVATIAYCHGRALSRPHDDDVHDPLPSDAPNTELVLMRQDDELDTGFEIGRGDEIACWAQLDLALEDIPPGPQVAIEIDDLGAWRIRGMRFAWEVAILRSDGSSPQFLRGNLPSEQSHRLLRRYRAQARRSHGPQPASRAKWLESLFDPPSHCRLDEHRVARALKERGETWDAICKHISPVPILIAAPIELGTFVNLAVRLNHADPDELLARPQLTELHVVLDDHLLRALIPRVDHVRYCTPASLDPRSKAEIRDCIESLAASIALQRGLVPVVRSLPDAVYATEGEELRERIAGLGLDLFVGLMPHFVRVPEELDAGQWEAVSPYAIGTSLFLDIVLPQ